MPNIPKWVQYTVLSLIAIAVGALFWDSYRASMGNGQTRQEADRLRDKLEQME